MAPKILVSRLFKDSDRLQQCAAAVHLSDHVEEGDSGLHVALIHRFLINSTAAKSFMQKQTDPVKRAKIVEDFILEIRFHDYGRVTAMIVLDYKTDRDIINPQYEKTADDVVGKMTIKQMDSEAKFISTLNQSPTL